MQVVIVHGSEVETMCWTKTLQGHLLLVLILCAGGAFLLSSCTRPVTSPSHSSLNPVKARGFPIWMPALPECTFAPENLQFSQFEPNGVDDIVIYLSTQAQCGKRTGSFSQLQMIVLDVETARQQNPKFWEGVESDHFEQLRRQTAGYVLAASKNRAWVKLGNVYLHIRGDAWLVEKLAPHYVKVYNEVKKTTEQVVQQLGAPEEAKGNFELLYDYREYRTISR